MTLEIDMVTAGIFTGQRQTGPTDEPETPAAPTRTPSTPGSGDAPVRRHSTPLWAEISC